jgi:hypothetical protein
LANGSIHEWIWEAENLTETPKARTRVGGIFSIRGKRVCLPLQWAVGWRETEELSGGGWGWRRGRSVRGELQGGPPIFRRGGLRKRQRRRGSHACGTEAPLACAGEGRDLPRIIRTRETEREARRERGGRDNISPHIEAMPRRQGSAGIASIPRQEGGTGQAHANSSG